MSIATHSLDKCDVELLIRLCLHMSSPLAREKFTISLPSSRVDVSRAKRSRTPWSVAAGLAANSGLGTSSPQQSWTFVRRSIDPNRRRGPQSKPD